MTLNKRSFITRGLCSIALMSSLHMPAFAQDRFSSEEKAMVHLLLSVTPNDNVQALGGGRYNYADPATNPYGHFSSDIQPWIMMGGSRSDTSSPKSRAKAYVSDIANGIQTAREEWPNLTPEQIAARSEDDLPAAWNRALDSEKSRQVFGMIDGTTEIDKKSLKSVQKAIRKGL